MDKRIAPLLIRECECGKLFRDPDPEHATCAQCRRREELRRMTKANGEAVPPRFGKLMREPH